LKYEGSVSPDGFLQIERDNPALLTMSIDDKIALFNDNIYSPRSKSFLKQHPEYYECKWLEKLNYHDLLNGIDADYWKRIGIPWEKEQMKKYNAKFAIELHSTYDLDDSENLYFSTLWQNGKMRSLLQKYITKISSRLPSNPIALNSTSSIPENEIFIGIHNVGFYHELTVEAIHGSNVIKSESNRNQAIEFFSESITDLTQFLRQEYHK